MNARAGRRRARSLRFASVAAVALATFGACRGDETKIPATWVRLAEGFQPPEGAHGASEDGLWRLSLGNLTGDALPLAAGVPCERAIDAAPGSTLSFTFAAHPGEAGAPVPRLRVALDGRELVALELASGERSHWHALELPEAGVRGGRLAFTLEGGGGEGAVFHPVIAPRAARVVPLQERDRPDVVLFLADTLRADLLAAYGGTAGLTPNLDRLAERAVRFECRSSATWTLPSISSLMTAGAPPQHGAFGAELALGGDARTLAEELGRNGYRTAAITDSVFVSARHGLDQGFEWFEEIPQEEWDLTRTLARALELVAEDDGRPLFLFVHTYRAHKPYRTGVEEDVHPYETAMAETAARADDATKKALSRRVLVEAATYRELYSQGVAALDGELGPWLERLEATGILERGLLVFTSDHGESFGEHDEIWHRGHPFDVQIRVPLLLASARLAPRVPETVASLVDVPRTVAAWCGVDAPVLWGGKELLAAAGPGHVFAFRLGNFVRPEGGRPSEAALLEGRRKVLTTFELGTDVPPVLRAAYDLAQDPAEERDLVRAGEKWPAELLEALGAEFDGLLEPRVKAGAVELDADARSELDGLGYAGDEDH